MSNMDRLNRAISGAVDALTELQRAARLPYGQQQWVPSSDGHSAYLVSWQLTCTCEGYRYRQTCRHIEEVKQRGNL